MSTNQSIIQSTNQLIGWFIDRSMDGWNNQHSGKSIDWLIDRLTNQDVNSLFLVSMLKKPLLNPDLICSVLNLLCSSQSLMPTNENMQTEMWGKPYVAQPANSAN